MARTLAVVLAPALNTGGTLTLPAVTGECHYITSIQITRAASAALAGSAVLDITSTNLNGLNWKVGNAMAVGGTQKDVELSFGQPLQSAAPGVASTIVFPAPGAGVQWIVNVTYYTGVAQ